MAGGESVEQQREGLVAYLQSIGFTDAQIAANEDRLLGLASHRVLFGDEERVTVDAIARASGCDAALVRRVRLASGLPDDGGAAVCSPREIEVMQSFLLGVAVLGEEQTLQFTRVLGSATAGLAEAALATFASNQQVSLYAGGADLADVARAGAEATTALLGVPPVLDVLLRLHFDLANANRFSGDEPGPQVDVAIGFVDLVESTQLTLALSGAEMAAALSAFERSASDAVVGVGGRVVKRIGDAVMFVTSDPLRACAAARVMLDSVAEQSQFGGARGAVMYGRVLPRDGDYFGAIVNLAARAVALADPGAIVVGEAVRDALAPDATVALGDHVLKGFAEPVPLFLFRGNRTGT